MPISSFNGTLTTISFYILLAVANRPLHGHAIRGQIIEDSEGSLIVATGTLYPALDRLVKQGLTERISPSLSNRSDITAFYRITAYGSKTLQSEARRYARVSLHARYKLGEQIFRPR
jgi:DNA-binding PadR family transcriptional regulator